MPDENTPTESSMGGTPSQHGPVPLQEMSLGRILDAAIKIYRFRWRTFAGITAAIMVPYLALQSLAASRLGDDVASGGFLPAAPGTPVQEPNLAAMVAIFLLAIGQIAFATPVLTGAITRGTSEIYLGRSPTLRELFGFAVSRLGSILLVSLLTFLAVAGGLLLLIIPGIIFGIRLYLATAALIVEGHKGRAALRRSWQLTKGYSWKVFGTVVVASLLAFLVAAVVAVPLELIGSTMGFEASLFFQFISSSIATVITTPFVTIVVVLLYFDIRIRKEAFDLAVMAQDLGQSTPPG